MEDTIHLWLQEKANYIYHNKYEKNSYSKFYNRVEHAFLQSMIHAQDHEPTPFFIVKKMQNKKKEVVFKKLAQGNNTAKSFNQRHYASLQDVVDKMYLLNNHTNLNNTEKYFFFFKHLGNAKDEMLHEHYVREFDPIRYSEFLNSSDLMMLNKDYSLNNVNDFLDTLVEQISKTTDFKEIEEIGYFYPVQYRHNLFSDKHYLFEINPYKFHLIPLQNSKIDKFLSSYYKLEYYQNKQIDYSTYVENWIPLHSGAKFIHSVAYFNPFQILEKKYEKELSVLNKYMNDHMNQETSKKLWLELLKKINELTFYFVRAQFETLLSSILIKEYNSKKYSKKRFLQIIIDDKKSKIEEITKLNSSDLKNSEVVLMLLEENIKLEILEKMYQFYEKYQLAKNHKIKPEDLEIYDSYRKNILLNLDQNINLFYSKLGSLQLLHTHGLDRIKSLLKDFKVPQKFHKSFNLLFSDIITFGVPSNMKNMLNEHIYKVHQNIDKNRLEKLYGFSYEV